MGFNAKVNLFEPQHGGCRLLKLTAAVINMACGLLLLCVCHYVKTAVVDKSFTHY